MRIRVIAAIVVVAAIAVVAVAGVLPAFAEPDSSPRQESCSVTIVRAPEHVRREVERWVRAESWCTSSIELRVVPTDDGLYLIAIDDRGHVRDRIVPDAQSVGVLVASWIADDAPRGARSAPFVGSAPLLVPTPYDKPSLDLGRAPAPTLGQPMPLVAPAPVPTVGPAPAPAPAVAPSAPPPGAAVTPGQTPPGAAAAPGQTPPGAAAAPGLTPAPTVVTPAPGAAVMPAPAAVMPAPTAVTPAPGAAVMPAPGPAVMPAPGPAVTPPTPGPAPAPTLAPPPGAGAVPVAALSAGPAPVVATASPVRVDPTSGVFTSQRVLPAPRRRWLGVGVTRDVAAGVDSRGARADVDIAMLGVSSIGIAAALLDALSAYDPETTYSLELALASTAAWGRWELRAQLNGGLSVIRKFDYAEQRDDWFKRPVVGASLLLGYVFADRWSVAAGPIGRLTFRVTQFDSTVDSGTRDSLTMYAGLRYRL